MLVDMGLSARITRSFKRLPPLQEVSDTDLWDNLQRCEDLGLLQSLHDFGMALITEAQSRTALIDSKATSLLGWHGVASAFFLGSLLQFQPGTWPRIFIVLGVLAAGLGTVLAFRALHVRDFYVPSALEWLELTFVRRPAGAAHERCDDELAIRRRHLAHLLRWHRSDNQHNAEKSYFVRLSFWCLLVVGVVIPLITILIALRVR